MRGSVKIPNHSAYINVKILRKRLNVNVSETMSGKERIESGQWSWSASQYDSGGGKKQAS